MSRQNYYARRKERQRRRVDGQFIRELVRAERRRQPRLGTRKLYHKLKPKWEQAGVQLGRDRLFEELRQADLLLSPVSGPYPHTTQSHHNLPVFSNLVQGRPVERPNQVWVSDLSYVRTQEGFVFMALITDAYSRKIVGSHAAETLEAQDCLVALEGALGQLPAGARPVHHSDRGCQYCSHEYVERLGQAGLAISMTELNHCAENALAERVNGILKQEYGLGQEFRTKAQARQALRQAVWLYNTERPHTALGYRVPEEVHQSEGSRVLAE